MSSHREHPAPQRGDVIVRAAGARFELIDAASDAVLACEIPSVADAIEEARSRNAGEIWQQAIDGGGNPTGHPTRLQRKRAAAL